MIEGEEKVIYVGMEELTEDVTQLLSAGSSRSINNFKNYHPPTQLEMICKI